MNPGDQIVRIHHDGSYRDFFRVGDNPCITDLTVKYNDREWHAWNTLETIFFKFRNVTAIELVDMAIDGSVRIKKTEMTISPWSYQNLTSDEFKH